MDFSEEAPVENQDPMVVETVDEQLEKMDIHTNQQNSNSPVNSQKSPYASPMLQQDHLYTINDTDTEDQKTHKLKLKERLTAIEQEEKQAFTKMEINAKKYLDEFYIKYNENKEKKFKENRQKDAEVISENLESGNPWLSAVKMFDINKNKIEGLERMRNLLLDLSTDPNAPGL